MANWASTSYAIEGSKSDLERVFNVIDGFVKGNVKPVEENTSKEWEGNIVTALGATDEQMKNNYLRGFIQTYEIIDGVLHLEAEEAWGTTDFRHLLAKLMPELTIYYIVEECGCEVYATNDCDGKYFTESYYVDICIDGDYFSEYFDTEKQVLAYVAQLLKKEAVTMAEIDEWNEIQDDSENYIYVHEFEYVA
ncbi:hypothetical protein [Prevotella disiens]|uniref:YubB ferredoxin-like domain-containing protein n=1 Tax=Prevotella disiens TaxID=28130 RepID=A0A3E4QK63_9BACT|nr:hypothetical protein [Prevotella disiens]RGK99444.1 hypothetical protein DXC89_06750 [Prevotella disiens]